MEKGTIHIETEGEKVSITIDGNISPLDAINLLMNALDEMIRQNLEEPEKRTKLAKLIGKSLEAMYLKEEKMDDQKRTPANLC